MSGCIEGRNPTPLGVLLALAASLLTAGCSRDASEVAHLERAEAYLGTGEFEKARIEYLNVLKLDPTNAAATARLAALLYDRGELGSAIPLLLRARELSPDKLDVRRRLGQAMLQAGRLEEARSEAQAILRVDSGNDDGVLILSRTAEDSRDVALLRGNLEELKARLGDRAAIEVALGNLAMQADDLVLAEASFKRALATDPDFGRAKLALGSLYSTLGRTNEAAALFASAAQGAGPASLERLLLAQHRLQSGAREEARQILELAAKARPDNVSISLALGELALAEGDLIECSNRVARVLRQDSSHHDGLLLYARLHRTRGDPAKAVEVLQRAQGIYPSSPVIAFELGATQVANRNLPEAINRLYGALALEPEYPEANLLLADLLMAQGNAAAAVRTLREFVGQRPGFANAQLKLATAHYAEGRLDDALAAAETYLQKVTNDASGAIVKGLILRQQGKQAAARVAFEQAAQLDPQSEAVLYQLVELDLIDNRPDAAMGRVQAALQDSRKSPGLTYLLARVHLAQNQVEPAEAALNRTIELSPNFSLGYAALLDLYAARGDYVAALGKLEAFLAQRPGNVGALVMKAMLHDRFGDVAQAQAAYSAALATNANVVPALNNLAYLYAESLNDVQRAHALATRARELAPEDPGVADTLGWIEYRRGAYDLALRLIQESVTKLPQEAEVHYHLGMTRYMMGQTDLARRAFERALELSTNFPGRTNAQQYLARLTEDATQSPQTLIAQLKQQLTESPNDPVAWQRLAELHAQQGAVPEAKGAYEQAVRANPKSAYARLGLAGLYAGPLQDPARALELAKEARSLAPSDSRATHGLGRIAFQIRDYAWANSLLSEAARLQPEDATIAFESALAAYTQGRVPEARLAAARALKLKPDFGAAPAAKEFLSLTAVEDNPSLAVELTADADKVLATDPRSVPGLMVRALGLEQQGETVKAQQAYDRVLGVYPAFLPAMKRSAILLTGLGADDQRAYALASKCREAYPRDAELAKALGWLSQRRGDHRYAAQLLEQATRERSGDAQAFFLLGVSQQQLGRHAESKATLAKAIELAPQADFVPEARAALAKLD